MPDGHVPVFYRLWTKTQRSTSSACAALLNLLGLSCSDASFCAFAAVWLQVPGETSTLPKKKNLKRVATSSVHLFGVFSFMFLRCHHFLSRDINVQMILCRAVVFWVWSRSSSRGSTGVAFCLFVCLFFYVCCEVSGTHSSLTCADGDVCLKCSITRGLHFDVAKKSSNCAIIQLLFLSRRGR